jgi:hypothetical protein
MSARYKSRPITPVDAVMWNGTNLEEVQTLCPEVEVRGTMLVIPTETGPMDVYVGDYVMKNVAGGKFTKLDADVFDGLYMPQ